jgi:hypothetical protein
LLSSPKGLNLFKGDEIVLQSFYDSQGRLEAREKRILSDCYPTSSPNASYMCLQMIPTYTFSQSKPSMWQNERKKKGKMILNLLSAYVFWLIPLYEEGSKCGAA